MLKKFVFITLLSLMSVLSFHSKVEMASLPSDVTESVSAPFKISVILDTPAASFAEPEKIYKTVDTSLKKIFSEDSKYQLQPLGDTDAYVQLYREEKEQATTVDNGIVTTNGERDLSLHKDDLINISEHFGSDYMIYIRVTNSIPKFTGGFFTAGQKVNVILDFRVWSSIKNDFVYLKRHMTTGSSTSIYIGMGSSSRAIDRGLKKGLKEIEKDAQQIKAAMD